MANNVEENTVFFRRDHVIVGSHAGDFINRPFIQPVDQPNQNIVFDTVKKQWVELSEADFEKLGATHRLLLVRARDRIAAQHPLRSDIPQIISAHNSACRWAYIAAICVEAELEARLQANAISLGQIIVIMKKKYSQIYSLEYQNHLHG